MYNINILCHKIVSNYGYNDQSAVILIQTSPKHWATDIGYTVELFIRF